MFTEEQLKAFLLEYTKLTSEYNGGANEQDILGFEVHTSNKEKAIKSIIESFFYFTSKEAN
jgi:hypothetical protein